MKCLTRKLFVTCGLIIPVPLVAQITASHQAAHLRLADVTLPMRPSMVARYAARTAPTGRIVAKRDHVEQLAKHLMPSVASLLGLVTHSHPLPLIAAGMVCHER